MLAAILDRLQSLTICTTSSVSSAPLAIIQSTRAFAGNSSGHSAKALEVNNRTELMNTNLINFTFFSCKTLIEDKIAKSTL